MGAPDRSDKGDVTLRRAHEVYHLLFCPWLGWIRRAVLPWLHRNTRRWCGGVCCQHQGVTPPKEAT